MVNLTMKGTVIKRFTSCEFGETWEDLGFNVVRDANVVVGLVDKSMFLAKENDSQIILSDEKGSESTLLFQQKAAVLVGEQTISYRLDEMMKPPKPPAPTRGTT